MVITSAYAANVGTLVCNIANKGYLVKLQTETSIIGGQTLYMQVVDVKRAKSVREALSEKEIASIEDINIIADALIEKLRKS